MGATVQPRYRRRVPCRMSVGEQRYSGVVLNLSGSGVFVQTSAAPEPGEPIELELGDDIGLRGEIVWRRKVAPELRSVAQGGVGVRIRSAPESYYALVEQAALAEHSLEASAEKPGESTQRFRARLRHRAEIRTRSLDVDARDRDDAERCALARVGEGWKILEIKERE